MFNTGKQLEDLKTIYRADEYTTDENGEIGFEDKTDGTAVWFRLIRGSYYFSGRTSLKWLNQRKAENQ